MKISNRKIYIVVLFVVICILVSLLIRIFFSNRELRAFVTPLIVTAGMPVYYTDSTFFASGWKWEFGDSISSPSSVRSGEHVFTESGVYQVKLTVNNRYQKYFMVNVQEPLTDDAAALIRIHAPSVAMQGELVVFEGRGEAGQWKWSFGETGIVDSREKLDVYAYSKPGVYQVWLETEDTKYPVIHTIQILPAAVEEEADLRTQIGNDIRERLQAIVDGKPFNPNYNYIMDRYLCKNPNILVVVNDLKTNDFYSYCQGLKIIGRKSTTILNVLVFPDEKDPECMRKLHVSQININNY